jgi:hypothetical protein
VYLVEIQQPFRTAMAVKLIFVCGVSLTAQKNEAP